ncbi:DUF2142 domain-containing protein [Cryobacterium sp. TMT2-15-1]|uniref:DUF2142 domain-containing protein n=1 Tax=Cryobacterium sp. TMT2-15-1 TaxID=1259246 RepID=UPI00141BBF5B|nr:DUF2142 domain-containing protein [Cryobacterium sp. TMT2-15-1]
MKTSPAPSARSLGIRFFAIAFVLFLAPMAIWSLASPLMSVPDEPSHVIRAASVVRGDIAGHPRPEITWQIEATVPNYIAHAHELTCFAFDPTKSAGCQGPVVGNPDSLVVTGTTAGSNSPVYYAIIGLPTLIFSGSQALYAMRLTNAIVCAFLAAGLITSLMQLPRARWTILSTSVAVTPMVLFLGGSANPNGIEVFAAATLFSTLVATLSTHSPARVMWGRGTLIVASVLLLTGTRSIALLWVLLAFCSALFFARRSVAAELLRTPVAWVTLTVSALVCAGELIWFTRPSVGTPSPVFEGAGTPFRKAFAQMLDQTLDFGQGWIGLFGWVDRPAPMLTFAIWITAMGALLLVTLALSRGPALYAVLFLTAAIVAVPAISQAAIAAEVGFIWQGRYTLALVVCLVLACGVALDRAVPFPLTRVSRNLTVTALITIAVGHVVCFIWVLRRYVVGTGSSWPSMINAPQWQPPGGWVPLTVAFSLAVGIAMWAIWRALSIREIDEPTRVDRRADESTSDTDTANARVATQARA